MSQPTCALVCQRPFGVHEQAAAGRKASIQLQEKRAQVIEDLRLRVNALDKVFSWNSEYQRASHKVSYLIAGGWRR